MKNPILQLTLLLFLVGCTDRRTGSPSESEHHEGDEQKNHASQAPVSSRFSVDILLSDAARKKLIDSKETIIVSGDFTGHPKQGTEARYLDIKSGDVNLGIVTQEKYPGEAAIFKELNLNPDALVRINSQGPRILLSAYSGRRSAKNNLLRCDDYDGSFDSIRGRTIAIRCQLIAEPLHNPASPSP